MYATEKEGLRRCDDDALHVSCSLSGEAPPHQYGVTLHKPGTAGLADLIVNNNTFDFCMSSQLSCTVSSPARDTV